MTSKILFIAVLSFIFVGCPSKKSGSNFAVLGSDAPSLAAAPNNAIILPHVENGAVWKTCTGNCSSCPAGVNCGASSANFNPIVGQIGDPSIDGLSALFQIFNGPAYTTALWGQGLGKYTTQTNFLWDFYVLVDSTAPQSLEFDFFQAIGGVKYMFGSQCRYFDTKSWDTWDEIQAKWIHSSIPCKKFDPNIWHRVQWYYQRLPDKKLHYVALQVDGASYDVDVIAPSKPNSGFGDGIGIQIQLDSNSTGAGYNEWIDNATVTIW